MKSRLIFILRGLRLLTPAERMSALFNLALMMLAGLLEFAIVALVIPLVYAVVDPEKFAATGIGSRILRFLQVGSIQDIFVYLAGGLIVLIILANLVSTASRYLTFLHAARSVARLARETVQHCINAPYVWLMKENPTSLTRHVIDDIAQWSTNFIAPLLQMVQAAIMIAAPAAVAIALAPTSALVAFAIICAIAAAIMLTFRGVIRRQSSANRKERHRALLSLYAIVVGTREIKVTGRGEVFARHFDELYKKSNKVAITLRMWTEAPGNLILLLGQVGFLGTAIVLFLTTPSRVEVAAQLALIGIVVTRVLPPFNRFVSQLPQLGRAVPHVEALLKLRADFDRMNRRRPGGTLPVPADWRTVSLYDVWFRYPDRQEWALKQATLTLERGKFYGVVGRSGSGKTTLANIILGLLDPSAGTVRIGEKPLPELSLRDWQRRFGYVPQDVFLIDGTVRDNITFGEPSDDVRLAQCIEQAGLAEVVRQLPNGIDTEVGDHARQLSGGQRQRLAIARALFRNPEILFMDEGTSALDSITEAELFDVLARLGGSVTAIMIAHRVTSLSQCDHILVMEEGAIVDTGSYAELMQRSQGFRRLAAQDDATLVPRPAPERRE